MPILKAINEIGFEAPTKIQAAAIPEILAGFDVAGQAQTGTGKTAAFAIPVLSRLDPDEKMVQSIVMCPTRELAVQVTGEFLRFAKFMKNVSITPVYGGQPIQRQIRQIKEGSQIIVGTPGRVIDHLKRGTLKLDRLKIVVLDEVDEMLNMGFREDIETILRFSPEETTKQTVMFSATISPDIKSIMHRWFRSPKMIQVEGKAASADGIRQFIVEARDSMRIEGICRLLDVNQYRASLVFCNTRRTCDTLIGEMQSRGYLADVLHGDMSQSLRDKVMKKFRLGKIDVLVATDVAARGLDVDHVDAVFNYDIPQDPEYYVHRIGRTGRAGREGVAYTFSSGRKSRSIRYIENRLKTRIDVIPLPSVKEVEASQMNALLEDVKTTLESGGLRSYIEQIEAIAGDRFTPIEVAAALLRLRSAAKQKPDAEFTGRNASIHSDENAFEPDRQNRSNTNSRARFGKKNSGSKKSVRKNKSKEDFNGLSSGDGDFRYAEGDKGKKRKQSQESQKPNKSNKLKKKRIKTKTKDKKEPFYAPFIKNQKEKKSAKRYQD